MSPKAAAGSNAKSKKRLGVAALAIVAVFAAFFVLQTTDKKKQKQAAITANTQPAIMGTSSAAVQDYQKSLDQTANIAQSRTSAPGPYPQLNATTQPQAWTQVGQKPSAYPANYPPQPVSQNSGQSTIPPTAYSQPGYMPQALPEPVIRSNAPNADSEMRQERDELQREREKQVFHDRYGSSVALSRRVTTNASVVPTSGTAPAAASPVVAPASFVPPPAAPAAVTSSAPAQQAVAAPAKPKHPERQPGTLLLPEGTTIDTVLENRLNGTFAGPAKVMVTQDVYDRARENVIIPAGSILLGDVRPVQKLGEERLAVTFHRLLRTDGYTADLDTFTGLDQIGETALKDKVNHHYIQVFGVSVALGAIAGLSQMNTNYGYSTSGSDLYREGFASSVDSSAQRVLDKYTNILPTVVIREGTRVKVYLTNDLYLPPSIKHPIMD